MENAIVAGWKLISARGSIKDEQLQDRPNYWVSRPESLLSRAKLDLVGIGSGHDIYQAMLPALLETESELILVTCFWARSTTLNLLNECLLSLSRKAEARGQKVRVRLCFSSLSLSQKLFHTRSLAGQVYPESCWPKKFGLPDSSLLRGLDLQVKSIFVLPFSVMHPKFLLIDRKKAFLPSCNISWENWLEGCVELTGPIVDQFLVFYHSFWASGIDHSTLRQTFQQETSDQMCEAVFLPSPHHAFKLIDGVSSMTCPSTPLNLFILEAFAQARKNIYIQTPNLTARPVLQAILQALDRGIDVKIITSERLMILEQLVTARTTTSRCVRWLLKQHAGMIIARRRHTLFDGGEDGLAQIGLLSISFYTPRRDLKANDSVQTHFKLTMVDDEIVLLGSGNMDRASWVTSQELGVAVIDKQFAKVVKERLSIALQGRLRPVWS